VGSDHLMVGAGLAVVAVNPLLVADFELDVLVYVHGKQWKRKTAVPVPVKCEFG
jgi:hypothetical protein